MSLGSSPFWNNQALNFPGSPDLSINFSPSFTWLLMRLMLRTSWRLASYHLPRHLIGLSMIDGMSSPCTRRLNFFVVCPFLMIRLLDFLGLNFILAHVAVSSIYIYGENLCVSSDSLSSSLLECEDLPSRFEYYCNSLYWV